jgi:mevalonate pyrophosphate decarboxylase
MDAIEYDCIQCEILLLILVPHTHHFIPEFCHIFHEWIQEHINIDASLLQTLDKNRQHKVLYFVTQSYRKVVHRENDRPCAMHSPVFTKWIHSISTQSKPYISTL